MSFCTILKIVGDCLRSPRREHRRRRVTEVMRNVGHLTCCAMKSPNVM